MTLATVSGSPLDAPFSTGDRVRVRASYPGRMRVQGWTATVLTVERVRQWWKVGVRWDDPGPYLATWSLHHTYLDLIPLSKPPRFATVEEADRWLEQNALRSESCSL